MKRYIFIILIFGILPLITTGAWKSWDTIEDSIKYTHASHEAMKYTYFIAGTDSAYIYQVGGNFTIHKGRYVIGKDSFYISKYIYSYRFGPYPPIERTTILSFDSDGLCVRDSSSPDAFNIYLTKGYDNSGNLIGYIGSYSAAAPIAFGVYAENYIILEDNKIYFDKEIVKSTIDSLKIGTVTIINKFIRNDSLFEVTNASDTFLIGIKP